MMQLRLIAAGVCVLAGSGLAYGQSVSKLWTENCQNCHREDGSGGGAGTKTLLTNELMNQDFDARFFTSIQKGVGQDDGSAAMPAFGETLDNNAIWSLVVHTRELQARAWRKKNGSPTAKDGVYTARDHNYTITTILDDGLDTPWSVDFLPATKEYPTRFFVTNRPGKLELIEIDAGGKARRGTVAGSPETNEFGQGGLMDVALHPEFTENGWVYLAFNDRCTLEGKGKNNFTKVVRGKVAGDIEKGLRWENQETIFAAKQEHYVPSGLHFGCRLVFKKEPLEGSMHRNADGSKLEGWYLYFGIGERGQGEKAQDIALPNGKIYRVFADGTTPDDNPFAALNRERYGEIWSFGHRNPQGLAFDLDGQLWDTEHGPRGGDELNRIEKGRNYGWPIITFGINYNDTPLKTPWRNEVEEAKARESDALSSNFVMPVYRWLPSIGACGLDVVRPGVTGEAFPKWRGDFVAGGLSGENVDRIRVKDGKFVEREELVHGMGRVRDVVCGPGGEIYVVLNGPDKVVRLDAAK